MKLALYKYAIIIIIILIFRKLASKCWMQINDKYRFNSTCMQKWDNWDVTVPVGLIKIQFNWP